MARVWYVGTSPFREITPQDWDKIGVFGPTFQWTADNGYSIDQDLFTSAQLGYLNVDPEFVLNKEGPRPNVPAPEDSITRPYKLDAEIYKILSDTQAALLQIDASKNAAKLSETNARTSETNAATSRADAGNSAAAAKVSETNAKTSETNAKTSETNAKTSETNALASATSATSSKNAAKTSETNAKTSENNAKASEAAAKTSENNAKASENAAGTSATNSSNARDRAEAAAQAAEQAKLTYRGEWSITTPYVSRDVVSYNGSSYLASANIPEGQASPSSNAKWQLLAEKGAPGVSGDWGQLSNKPSTFPPSAHTHVPADMGKAGGTPSATTFYRGDDQWATPPNTTYSSPTQAEAEAGTSTTSRVFSALRVRQAANAAITARQWTGTQAEYDAITTKDPNVIYNIVE